MTHIWLNHWFSTAYNIINLIKENENEFLVIGSNENINGVYKSVCDEWFIEPVLGDEDYIQFCLDFCKEHHIDIFMPRRRMVAISSAKNRFSEIGVQVMVEDYELMKVLNDKALTYERLKKEKIGYIPEYYIVSNVADFSDAYDKLTKTYDEVCFKFVMDEGGKSYRLIDNSRKGYAALSKKQNSRMTLDDVIKALSEKETFAPIMIMPYLPGDEVSVDCLKTKSGIIMIPRIKNATRTERISYDKEILSMCETIYKEFDLQYPCNIQFKYLDNVPYFLEVNTRMSGGVQMACLASEVNIPNIAVNQMLGIDKSWENKCEERYVTHVELPILL